MKGDFSRLTFDPAKRYTSVRQQQGRLQLDADWNEQADVFLHQLETFAGDLAGPSGAPAQELLTFLVHTRGTVSSSGSNLIGVGTAFRADLRRGGAVLAAGHRRIVRSINNDTRANLDRPFKPNLPPQPILQVVGSGRRRTTGRVLVGTGT